MDAKQQSSGQVNEQARLRWLDFCDEIAARIAEIDDSVVWEEVEPRWWLEMMAVQRTAIYARRDPRP